MVSGWVHLDTGHSGGAWRQVCFKVSRAFRLDEIRLECVLKGLVPCEYLILAVSIQNLLCSRASSAQSRNPQLCDLIA